MLLRYGIDWGISKNAVHSFFECRMMAKKITYVFAFVEVKVFVEYKRGHLFIKGILLLLGENNYGPRRLGVGPPRR